MTGLAIREIGEGRFIELEVRCNRPFGCPDVVVPLTLNEQQVTSLPWLYVRGDEGVLVKEFFVPGLNWRLAVVFDRYNEASDEPPVDVYRNICRTT